jgi:oxepin-CoA hydrolase / 3-oxo-5,6-dehydrosuberyl-CoA semialdehyde dehydrogenase
MIQVRSYVAGRWHFGEHGSTSLLGAINGEPVAEVNSSGLDTGAMLRYARDTGGPAIRRLTFHQRALVLKELGNYLLQRKAEYYALSTLTGATKIDSWMDIDGGFGTLFTYSSKARRELPNDTVLIDGPTEQISKRGSFVGRHIFVSRSGVAIQINAFNFPVWGMLEKFAPAFLAGMSTIVKPATVSSYVAHKVAEDMITSGLLPEGSLQFIAGSMGDLLGRLTLEDSVAFTGSRSTGLTLRGLPSIQENSVPFSMEADSMNSSILGEDVRVTDEEFSLFVEEIAKEMTIKAGQRCTAIRRVFVPGPLVPELLTKLQARLEKIVVGDPRIEGVTMGPLVSLAQRGEVRERVAELAGSSERIEVKSDIRIEGPGEGAFQAPTLLHAKRPFDDVAVHEIEAFGPVTTVMGYEGSDELLALVKLGGGSLVSSIFTNNDRLARTIALGIAPYHGRLMIVNRRCASESTGHGSPLPHLVHGGPGRAGGGEELGGMRSVLHFMQRTALQGSPTTLGAVYREYTRGGEVREEDKHPFKKYLEELQIGDSLLTHRRTITEGDISNFAGVSGDFFYAHVDELAARDSMFGRRVAHGYFVLSAAAGLFVFPGPGPVIANYGLESLRFVKPVFAGDTIQVRLTCKAIRPKEGEDNGVVEWDVVVRNQEGDEVAVYTLLTLVKKLPRMEKPATV